MVTPIPTSSGMHQKVLCVIVNEAGTATIKISRMRENFAGSAGSGADGGTSRVYTLTTGNAVDIVETFLDGVLLVEASQYVIDNSAKTVKILINAWNTQLVSLFYNV